jgi:imidazolonepropionase-like amidohydrolase
VKCLNEKAIAIVGGRLIDGTGRNAIDDSVIIVKEGKIESVGKSGEIEIPAGFEVISTDNKTVMPGLVDAHFHFFGVKEFSTAENVDQILNHRLGTIRSVVMARILLENGFTAIRDCGGRNALALKLAIEERTIIGPRIMASGPYISQTGGHGDIHYLPLAWAKQIRLIADGPHNCRRAVRESIREGADFIKIMTSGGTGSVRDPCEIPQFTIEEIRAMVDEAHTNKKRIATHCYCIEGAKNSIEAGIDTIEHGSLLGRDEEVLRKMAEKNIVLVPTLSIIKLEAEHGEELNMPKWTYMRSRELIKEQYITIMKAHAAGVKIALGTDYMGLYEPPYPRIGSNAYELQLLVEETKFTPMEAIVSGTQRGAEAMGLESQIGTLEPGKLADIIIVDGDPLKDITMLQSSEKIQTVIKNGEIIINK